MMNSINVDVAKAQVTTKIIVLHAYLFVDNELSP